MASRLEDKDRTSRVHHGIFALRSLCAIKDVWLLPTTSSANLALDTMGCRKGQTTLEGNLQVFKDQRSEL